MWIVRERESKIFLKSFRIRGETDGKQIEFMETKSIEVRLQSVETEMDEIGTDSVDVFDSFLSKKSI